MPCLVLISWTFRTVLLSMWNIRHGLTSHPELPLLVHCAGIFPLSVDLIWTPCQNLSALSVGSLLASLAGAGPGCFEEWPFHQGWPTELAGMGSGNRFWTQSGLLLVNCCSTLSLNTVICMIYPTSEITWICEIRFPSLSHQEGRKGKGEFCALPWRNWESACQSRRFIRVAGGFLSFSAAQSFSLETA